METALCFNSSYLPFSTDWDHDFTLQDSCVDMMNYIDDLQNHHFLLDTVIDGHDSFMALDDPLPCNSIAPASPDPRRDTTTTTRDLLLAAAEAVDAERWHHASAATATVLWRLRSDGDTEHKPDPFDRLAYYFALGVQSIWAGRDSCRELAREPIHSVDLSAHHMVQELTPYTKFANFTANQAILEAAAGHRKIHIVDFDIADGIQWPPLIADLSRCGVSLRITAAVVADAKVVERTGRRLVEFAESVGLSLQFDTIIIENADDFNSIEISDGPVIVNCMLYQHQQQLQLNEEVFIDGIRRLQPQMVVLVEDELFSGRRRLNTSFMSFFWEAVEHFLCVYESIICGFINGGYKSGIRIAEREMLGPRIVESVSRFSRGLGGDGFSMMEGFKSIGLSRGNVSQAKFLVGVFSGGYRVEQEQERLALCWKSKPLISVSVWVPSRIY